MALIDSIINGELGSSVRAKLNAVIAWVNEVKTNVTENADLNLFWGKDAGINTVAGGGVDDGDSNTFVGAETGKVNISGGVNTVVGAQALSSNKVGNRNTSFGGLSMENHLAGDYNMANGYQSMGFDVLGVFNTALGYKSMRENIGGVENTALGYKALQDMNGTNGQITAFADLGGGQIQVTSAAHGQSNGTEVVIKGTGPYVNKLWQDNYDGTYIISNVTTDTFEITAAYVDESLLLSFGYWFIDGEGSHNLAVGDSAGIGLRKGSYNTLIGYGQQAVDPNDDFQLGIHFGMITGIYGGDIRQRFIKVDGKLILGPHTDPPYGATAGAMYFNSTDNHFYGYNGTSWVQLDN
jgi:hypothetical protein